MAHSAISWSGAASFDPILSGEVTLKLALVHEARAGSSELVRSGLVRSASGEIAVHAGTDGQEPKDATEVRTGLLLPAKT